MKNPILERSLALPALYGELAIASWETILHRTVLIMSGTCSAAEYRRMILEKSEAVQHATIAWITGGSEQAVLKPFHAKAQANAKRLRSKAK